MLKLTLALLSEGRGMGVFDLLFLESGCKWPICFDIFDGLLLENGDFPYYSYVSLLQSLPESCGWK